MQNLTIAFALCLGIAEPALAKDCWALSDVKGQSAYATAYAFRSDALPNSMVLCFDEKTGSVSGDDTPLVRIGESTLVGGVVRGQTELFEVYQIDRANGKVLFTKTRLGSNALLIPLPDVVAAFVGRAVRLP